MKRYIFVFWILESSSLRCGTLKSLPAVVAGSTDLPGLESEPEPGQNQPISAAADSALTLLTVAGLTLPLLLPVPVLLTLLLLLPASAADFGSADSVLLSLLSLALLLLLLLLLPLLLLPLLRCDSAAPFSALLCQRRCAAASLLLLGSAPAAGSAAAPRSSTGSDSADWQTLPPPSLPLPLVASQR